MAELAITGSSGEVGGRVARALAERGIEQRLIVRDRDRAPELAGSQVAVASYDDGEAVRAALDGARTLFFVSGTEAPGRSGDHRTVVAAAADAGVERVVYTSIAGASPDHTLTFGRDHWDTEQTIRETGLSFTFLRNSLYLDFLPLMAGPDRVIRGPAGDGRLAPVSRDDVAAAAIAALTSGGEFDGSFEISGPDLFDLAEAAARLSAHTGEEYRYVEETVEEAWESRRPLGYPEFAVAGMISSYQAIADGSLGGLSGDVERLTGRPPQTLEQCLDRYPELLEV